MNVEGDPATWTVDSSVLVAMVLSWRDQHEAYLQRIGQAVDVESTRQRIGRQILD